MERLTFFCLGGTAYLSRSYQLIISWENYCPTEIWFKSARLDYLRGRNILDSHLPVDATRTGCEIVSSSFFRSAGCFIVKYSFAALLILCNNVSGESLFGVNCQQRHGYNTHRLFSDSSSILCNLHVTNPVFCSVLFCFLIILLTQHYITSFSPMLILKKYYFLRASLFSHLHNKMRMCKLCQIIH